MLAKKIKCPHCSYEFIYKGKKRFSCYCSDCTQRIMFEKHKDCWTEIEVDNGS